MCDCVMQLCRGWAGRPIVPRGSASRLSWQVSATIRPGMVPLGAVGTPDRFEIGHIPRQRGELSVSLRDKIVKTVEGLRGKATDVAGKLTDKMQPGPGTDAADSQEDSTDEFISHSSWMTDIPDDVPVTTLSIPGTHDSACIDGPLDFAKTQNLDIPRQLNAGIRFLDIRLSHYQDDLRVHHDAVYMGKSYKDVLKICSDFLVRHPSETILMLIQAEDRFDSSLGDFAPLKLSGGCSGESPSLGTIRVHSRMNSKTRRGSRWVLSPCSTIFPHPLLVTVRWPPHRRSRSKRQWEMFAEG